MCIIYIIMKKNFLDVPINFTWIIQIYWKWFYEYSLKNFISFFLCDYNINR